MSYAKLLIPFLIVCSILTINPGKVRHVVRFIVFRGKEYVKDNNTNDNRFGGNESSNIENNSMSAKEQQHTLYFPNILLIGVQKGGTTGLARTLFRYYGVCKAEGGEGDSKKYVKEVHFFDGGRFRKGLEFYSKRYQHCNGQPLAMDATPDYLAGYSPKDNVPEKVRIAYDSAGQTENLKIIAVLREPVSRELSLYNHKHRFYLEGRSDSFADDIKNENGAVMNFTEYVKKKSIPDVKKGTSYGLYSQHLKKWFSSFDRKQILVLSYDEFVQDETTYLRRVLQFLGLEDRKSETSGHAVKMNVGGAEKASMPCSSQLPLARAFAESNEELYALLEAQPGPPMEQRPFPKFQLGNCSTGGDNELWQ